MESKESMPLWLQEYIHKAIQKLGSIEKVIKTLQAYQVGLEEGQKAYFSGDNKKARFLYEKLQSLCKEIAFPNHEVLGSLGDVYFREGKNEEAFKRYTMALEEVGRKGRSQMTDREGRLDFNKYCLRSYNGAVRSALACAKEMEKKDAIQAISWELEAISLLEESRGVEVNYELGQRLYEPPKIMTEDWDFLQEHCENEPFPEPDPETISESKSVRTLVDTETEFVEPVSFPEEEIPAKKEERNLSGLFSLEEMKRALDEETVLIGYFLDNNTVYGYSMDIFQGKMRFLQTPHILACGLENILEEWKEFLAGLEEMKSNKDMGRTQLQWQALTNLYNDLEIEEALQKIQEKRNLSETTLLFSPENFLHNLPFWALCDEENHCLYEKVRDIHTTISLRTLALQKNLPCKKELKCTFWGVPGIFEYDKESGKTKIKDYLMGIRTEAKRLLEILGKDRLLCFGYEGKQEYRATSERIRKLHSAGSLFYFSGHGTGHGPILLDGHLSWQDIVKDGHWNFSNQLTIILSSCMLGQQESIGKEMLGMISTLFSKGGSSVVSALWAVDDYTTSHLLPQFVEYLQENMAKGVSHPRAIAMKSAMKWLREWQGGKYDSPYYFAPFFVSGLP